MVRVVSKATRTLQPTLPPHAQFLAGASGALGRRLLPLLLANNHQVTALTHSAHNLAALRSTGAYATLADGLDAAAIMQAVTQAKPDIIIHQMTALIHVTSLRNFDRQFALTNRLRTEGTDNLLQAARAAGVRRFIAQSYGNWVYQPTGTEPKTEQDPLDPAPPANQRQSLAAIRNLEHCVTTAPGIEGIVLRYGNFYGPGTGFSSNGIIPNAVRKRMLPVIGNGAGVWSFIHIDDAATATMAAIDQGTSGIYNIVDNEPASAAVWLPELAKALGAKPPRRIPLWLGRLIMGEVGISMMTRMRGASNRKARTELAWNPRYATWRDGFRTGLADPNG